MLVESRTVLGRPVLARTTKSPADLVDDKELAFCLRRGVNSFSGSADGGEVCSVGGHVAVALAGHSNETKTIFETKGKAPPQNSNPAPPRPAPFLNRRVRRGHIFRICRAFGGSVGGVFFFTEDITRYKVGLVGGIFDKKMEYGGVL
jgi:hypothetical protein